MPDCSDKLVARAKRIDATTVELAAEFADMAIEDVILVATHEEDLIYGDPLAPEPRGFINYTVVEPRRVAFNMARWARDWKARHR